MADLIKLVSRVKYGDGAPAAVTLGSHNNDGVYSAVLQRANDPKWSSTQLWRREALTVTQNDRSWIGLAFTIPSPNHGPRLALQYNGPNTAVTVAPYGSQIAQQLWRLAWQDYQNGPYAALGMFDPVHPIFLSINSNAAQDNQPIYSWSENDGKVKLDEYWTMQAAFWTVNGKETAINEATGVEPPAPVSVVKTVFNAAHADSNYFQLLLAAPASVFDAAGYAIPNEYVADFDRFYRSHSGVQALHAAIAAGQSLDSVPFWVCTACQIACYVAAVGVAAIGVGAVALLTTTSAPVVAVAALLSVSSQVALAVVAALVAAAAGSVEIIVSKLCELIGVC
ncbi:hypothetical protein OGR47_02580 [Methylocystis sp. MJC1]|uniref:hypothetical protein n=1 Tax=Methylocystis sp. MJC1 TaxID=2654282 RepID=UPI0013ED86F0|nr:hypothetical protein [Methylocystis sp. MJC1]KAF2989147.1 hypothetical protein MJC1_03729 [Methylocystis sp. MJC1]MBU6525898.1 hypothetical protein [Methylocystis sp. MJC1]UZX12365.1 hypothetical protein OGR47_02580 [Methylocystis sp. MJC1]